MLAAPAAASGCRRGLGIVMAIRLVSAAGGILQKSLQTAILTLVMVWVLSTPDKGPMLRTSQCPISPFIRLIPSTNR